jgi:hypothetical protein
MSSDENKMFVQFDSPEHTAIISKFGCPQDPATWPNMGEVSVADPRYRAYFESVPESVKTSWPQPEDAS